MNPQLVMKIPTHTRPSPPIVETVYDDPTDDDSAIPDLVPDMFQNTPRNLSKTSFASVDDNEPTTNDDIDNRETQMNPNPSLVDRLTDNNLTNLTSGKTRMTRLLNLFGFTIEPYTITLLDDIGATDDHAIMDLTSWDPNTLYDVIDDNHILKQHLPNPTSRFYYICNLLTTLKVIRLYYQQQLGHSVDKDGLFAPNIGFNTLEPSKRPSLKRIENFILKNDDTFLDIFNSMKSRLPTTESTNHPNPILTPRPRLRPTRIQPSKPIPPPIPTVVYPDPKYTINHHEPNPDTNFQTDQIKQNSPQSVTAFQSINQPELRPSYVPRGSNYKPIYDKPIPGTSDPSAPPRPNPYRDQHWEERGRQAPSPTRTYPKRHPLPSTVKWNGEDRTFTKFDTAISAWLLSAGMGYIDHPDFIQAYRDGGWNYAQYLSRDISHQQFQYDNELLFGALLSSVQKRGSRRVEDLKHTRDGLRAWIELKDYFGGDNNPTLKMDRLRKELDLPYSSNFEGGFLGYLDHMAHIYNKMDIEDPKFKHHGPTNDEIRVTTIRNRFANTPYARVTYDYYEQMAHNNRFDVEEYINRLTRYYHHMENDLATYSQTQARHLIQDSTPNATHALVSRSPSSTHTSYY